MKCTHCVQVSQYLPRTEQNMYKHLRRHFLTVHLLYFYMYVCKVYFIMDYKTCQVLRNFAYTFIGIIIF